MTPLLFQASLGSVAPVSMVRRVYQCMCNIDHGSAASPASGKFRTSAASGVGVIREQLVIFLADTLRGTAEERAPLVLTMSQPGPGTAKAVTGQQVTEVSRCNIKCGISVPVSVRLLVNHLSLASFYLVSFIC